MAEHQLSHDDFFAQLSTLFDTARQKDHGSIFLTQKRLTYGSEDSTKAAAADATSPYADLSPSAPLPLIIRATNGKSKDKRANKVKISTLVQPDALDVFFARYAEVCKAGMSGLKKRDRSKAKEKLKAKKKKLGAAAPAEVKK